MKRLLSYSLLLVIPLLFQFGCEKNRDKVLNSDLFYRTAGTLKTTSARIDSVTSYKSDMGSVSISIAGKYQDMSAFTLVKFAKPLTKVLNTLDKAVLKFTVSNVWTEGINEFELYATNSDWEDTTKINSKRFLDALGTPFAVVADTSSTFSTLIFDLDEAGIKYLKSWQSNGSFLLKNSSSGTAMIGVYTNEGLSPPKLILYSHADTESDTTNVTSIDGNYSFDNGLSGVTNNKRSGILSEGNYEGFIMYFSLPDSFSSTNAVNRCKLVMPIDKNFIPSENTLDLSISILTASYAKTDSTAILSSSTIDYTIKPGDTVMELDFSSIFNTMYKSLNYNYGILFKPSDSYLTPSQVFVSAPDSISITYTTLPEVR
ncbi:MAG: hypothetical protein WCU00_12125 [Candidatus Latescibacterota bacterium]